MAPVNPGSNILWVKHPQYTVDLFHHLAALPRTRAHALFGPASSITAQAKGTRDSDLRTITEALFIAEDATQAIKQRGSVTRRLGQLLKSYQDDIQTLNYALPPDVDELIDDFTARIPHWLDLHALLEGHRSVPSLNPNIVLDGNNANAGDAFQGNAVAGPVHPPAPPVPASPAQLPAVWLGSDDADDDAMEGVEFQVAQPRPDDDDDDDVAPVPTLCFKCEIALPDSPSLAEAHMRDCFESSPGAGAHVTYCVVCDVPFHEDMRPAEREAHVIRCLDNGGRNAVSERDDFVFNAKSIPRHDDGTTKECTICFEAFEVSELGTRILRCSCVFHTDCIARFWRGEQDKVDHERRICIVEH